jgi:hypothetical protein
MDSALMETLLWKGEGCSLDYKAAQYPFDGSSNDEKSGLLKDILAIANAWRSEDGYILIGVKEQKGARSIPLGVREHLPDNNIQQFVNSKTSRPVNFSCETYQFDGVYLDIIRLQEQERPVYLLKDFGKLRKDEVYIRRSSSTGTATLEEITKMGSQPLKTSKAAVLDVQFADPSCGTLLGKELTLSPTVIKVSEEKIPSYRRGRALSFNQIEMVDQSPSQNENYYKEMADYRFVHTYYTPLNFVVTNLTANVANDVKAIIEAPTNELVVLKHAEMPAKPEKSKSDSISRLIGRMQKTSAFANDVVFVSKQQDLWHLSISFGKVQPKQTIVIKEPLFFASRTSGRVQFVVQVYHDEGEPVPGTLAITFNYQARTIPLEEFLRVCDQAEPSED